MFSLMETTTVLFVNFITFMFFSLAMIVIVKVVIKSRKTKGKTDVKGRYNRDNSNEKIIENRDSRNEGGYVLNGVYYPNGSHGVRCTKCNAAVSVDAEYCQFCGSKVKK